MNGKPPRPPRDSTARRPHGRRSLADRDPATLRCRGEQTSGCLASGLIAAGVIAGLFLAGIVAIELVDHEPGRDNRSFRPAPDSDKVVTVWPDMDMPGITAPDPTSPHRIPSRGIEPAPQN